LCFLLAGIRKNGKPTPTYTVFSKACFPKLGKQAKLSLAKYTIPTIVVEKDVIDCLESCFGTDSATDFPPKGHGIGYCEHIEVRSGLLTMKGTNFFKSTHHVDTYLLFYLALYF